MKQVLIAAIDPEMDPNDSLALGMNAVRGYSSLGDLGGNC